MPLTALEKRLPGHSPLLLPFPWDPALPFPPQELPRDAGNSVFPPGREHLPFPRLPWKILRGCGMQTLRGAERTGEGQHGVGHAAGSPLPPSPRWPGTLCCWGCVKPQPDVKSSSATNILVAVCAGSEPRARVPKPNPRAVIAAHSSKIILKRAAGHEGPLPNPHRLQPSHHPPPQLRFTTTE